MPIFRLLPAPVGEWARWRMLPQSTSDVIVDGTRSYCSFELYISIIIDKIIWTYKAERLSTGNPRMHVSEDLSESNLLSEGYTPNPTYSAEMYRSRVHGLRFSGIPATRSPVETAPFAPLHTRAVGYRALLPWKE